MCDLRAPIYEMPFTCRKRVMNKISQTRLARTGTIHLMFTLFLSHSLRGKLTFRCISRHHQNSTAAAAYTCQKFWNFCCFICCRWDERERETKCAQLNRIYTLTTWHSRETVKQAGSEENSGRVWVGWVKNWEIDVIYNCREYTQPSPEYVEGIKVHIQHV